MRQFRYSALTKDGEVMRGERAALDKAAVIGWLHEQAWLPIDAEERTVRTMGQVHWRSAGPIPGAELALIAQQLARLLKAGLPLDRALTILIDLTQARRPQQALQGVLAKVRDGASLAEALATQTKCFPEAFVTLVRAGELSGALQAVLAETSVFLQRSEAMRQRVISAMVYPVILIVVAAFSVGLILTTVLPQFEPMFKEAGAKLPMLTRVVVATSDVVRGYWWLAAVAALGLGGVWRWAMRSPEWALARDRKLLGIPLVGSLILRTEIGRFCRTLGVMLASGVPAPTALSLAGGTMGNRVLAGAVEEAAVRFREGEGLSTPLARSRHFPALALQLIRIGEETGRLDEMLAETALLYDQEVQRSLERLLAALVPGLTVAMGLLIAIIVGAVMEALLSVNDLAI